MRTELIIPEHVPSVNGKGGMHRAHWSKKGVTIKKYKALFENWTTNRHPGQVSMTVTRLSLNPSMDFDNLVACYKHHIDAIVRAGIIKDDSPKVIVNPLYQQERALNKHQQMTIIIIEDIL